MGIEVIQAHGLALTPESRREKSPYEGHGFSRAAQNHVDEGFSHRGTFVSSFLTQLVRGGIKSRTSAAKEAAEKYNGDGTGG